VKKCPFFADVSFSEKAPDPGPVQGWKYSGFCRKNPRAECAIMVMVGTIEEKIYQRQVMKSGLAGGLESAGLGSWAAESAHFTPEELRKGFRVNRSGGGGGDALCAW
jgi:hypothetical protein